MGRRVRRMGKDEIKQLVREIMQAGISSWNSDGATQRIEEFTNKIEKLVKQNWYQDIVDFHKQVVLDNFPKQPYVPGKQLKLLRGELIIEEIRETLDAIDKDDLVKIADGIADSIVVLLGTAVTYGIDMRPIWDEVHRTNMLKKGGKRRVDGKLLKPKGWKSPEIERIVKEQQNVKQV